MIVVAATRLFQAYMVMLGVYKLKALRATSIVAVMPDRFATVRGGLVVGARGGKSGVEQYSKNME